MMEFSMKSVFMQWSTTHWFTNREWIKEQHKEGDEQEQSKDSQDDPLVFPPDDVAKGLERGAEPSEWCGRSSK